MNNLLLSEEYKQYCRLLEKQDEIIQKGWKNVLKTISQKDARDLSCLKKYVVLPVRKNTEMAIEQINILKEFVGEYKIQSVLEMGAGYGNLCNIFNRYYSGLNYTILDLDGMIRFAKQFLEDRNIKCNFVDIEKSHNVFNRNYDVFMSHNCLSETPITFTESFLAVLLRNKIAKNVFIIDCHIDFLTRELHKNYNNVIISEYRKKGKDIIYSYLASNYKEGC